MQQKFDNNSNNISKNPLEKLRYQKVIVRAMGLTYSGQLLGADDDSLFLKTLMRYVSLPMAQVSSVRAADDKETINKKKNIPNNFYLDPSLDPDLNHSTDSQENLRLDSGQSSKHEQDKPGEFAKPSGSGKDEA